MDNILSDADRNDENEQGSSQPHFVTPNVHEQESSSSIPDNINPITDPTYFDNPEIIEWPGLAEEQHELTPHSAHINPQITKQDLHGNVSIIFYGENENRKKPI
ncbi:MAG: hypothetical protein IJ418_15990 [Clostridia bacterium]|nr:hypothetical protein [Clostridia bacterium]